jgi:hypothetical protein
MCYVHEFFFVLKSHCNYVCMQMCVVYLFRVQFVVWIANVYFMDQSCHAYSIDFHQFQIKT